MTTQAATLGRRATPTLTWSALYRLLLGSLAAILATIGFIFIGFAIMLGLIHQLLSDGARALSQKRLRSAARSRSSSKSRR